MDSLSAFSEALAPSERGIDMMGAHLKASGTLVSTQLVGEEIAYSTAVLIVPDGIVQTARAEGLCQSECTVDVMYRDGLSQAEATAQLGEECEQARESGSVNEQWAGNFTEGDRVVINTLWKRIANNPQVADTIRRDGRQVFESSLLPKIFDEEARRAYVENTDSFTSLFENSEKYRAMMNAIGQLLVEKFR